MGSNVAVQLGLLVIGARQSCVNAYLSHAKTEQHAMKFLAWVVTPVHVLVALLALTVK